MQECLLVGEPRPQVTATPLPYLSGGRVASRTHVMAGDLHTSTVNSGIESTIDGSRPHSRVSGSNPTNSPMAALPLNSPLHAPGPLPPPAISENINLRDEVMACIAKSIGLIQPPISGSPSIDASPVIFLNSFSSLSFLEAADDSASTMTGASSALNRSYAMGLDNEVEILCFAAGTTLVKAGERNAGLFYAIDGFLDVSIPVDDSNSNVQSPSDLGASHWQGSTVNLSSHQKQMSSSSLGIRSNEGAQHRNRGTSATAPPTSTHNAHPNPKCAKYLFTVKPGGIAGYLASLTATPSSVDIKAKVDTYVGFLLHHTMERLIERRPIVLLTLSKRLISLLSPLGRPAYRFFSRLDASQRGSVLWRPGDKSDSFYIVINGRLRALGDKDGGIIGEYGQGDTVGELDVITSSSRTTTLHAIRDTASIDLVSKAIALSGTVMGLPIMVQLTKSERNKQQPAGDSLHLPPGVTAPPAGMQLYVGSLHFNLSESDIKQVFEPFGDLEFVGLHKDPQTGRSKGYAFVRYKRAKDAKMALE
ncbi:phosphatidylcholine and lysophosphatidylcholine phospholipase [Tulasnella sp. 403]|nr:phosphatidylcholine and lysophosphatidylcholine phospholipase [Tulasnella sp. 403]